MDIIGEARTVNKRTNGPNGAREIPVLPIHGKTLDKIQFRVGKIRDRLGGLITADVGLQEVDFTPSSKKKVF